MAEGKWKLESDLCRCCLNEGSHKNLAKPNFNITSGETEVYADMLLENIGLNLLPVDGVLSAVTYTICEPCIDQLRGVQYFKKQVQITEEKFWDLYKKNVFRTSASVVVKEEEVENPEPPDYRGDGENDGINIDDFSDEDTKLNLIEIKAESLKIKGKTKAKPRKRAKMTPTRRKASARKTTDKATGKATGKATLKTYPSAAKVKTIKKEEGDEDEAEDAAEDAEAEDAEPPAKKAKDGEEVEAASSSWLAQYTSSTAPKSGIPQSSGEYDVPASPEPSTACDVPLPMVLEVKDEIDIDNPTLKQNDSARSNTESDTDTESAAHKSGGPSLKASKLLTASTPHTSVDPPGKRTKSRFKAPIVNDPPWLKPSRRAQICDTDQSKPRKTGDFSWTGKRRLLFVKRELLLWKAQQKRRRNKTKQSPRTPKQFFCSHCNRLIKSTVRNPEVAHFTLKHKLKKCKQCPLSFDLKNMHRHYKTAHGELTPTCGVCGYQNMIQSAVDKHQRQVHMREKNFQCDQCTLSFFSVNELRRHQLNHSDVRPYECDICHKKFKVNGTMVLHRKIHTGEKNKVCPVPACGQAFVQKASLNYHMAKYHPGTKF